MATDIANSLPTFTLVMIEGEWVAALMGKSMRYDCDRASREDACPYNAIYLLSSRSNTCWSSVMSDITAMESDGEAC